MVSARDKSVTQARSRTVILGYLAAAAAGQHRDRAAVVAWFGRHGLAVGEGGLRDALSLRLRRRAASAAKEEDPAEAAWIRETIEFDATKLDLDLAVVVFPRPAGSTQLMNVLRSTERVVRLYEGYERDMVAVIVYDGARERRWLQTLLEEHEPRLRWIVVREVDDSPAATTWLSLARQVAGEERLLAR